MAWKDTGTEGNLCSLLICGMDFNPPVIIKGEPTAVSRSSRRGETIKQENRYKMLHNA